MMKRGGWLICLLALTIGAWASKADEVPQKIETSGKVDTLLGYLEKIKNSPFNLEGKYTEGKKNTGGVTSETLAKIKQMVSQRHSQGSSFPDFTGNAGSNFYDFGDLSLGHPGAHIKIRKPYRQNVALPNDAGSTNPNGYGGSQPYGSGGTPSYGGSGIPPYGSGGTPPYGSGGTPPYGGGTPPYGGGMNPYGGVIPPYGGGGSYNPGDSLPDIDYSDQHPLSKYDYEHIWVQMLQEIYKILKDKYLLEDTHLASKVLDHLFKMLNDIKILSKHTVETAPSCPKIYHRRGDLCLSVDFLTTFLDYHEARLYCQVVKGGDLVMWRDANEYADIQSFIKDIDSTSIYSYWVGVSEAKEKNDWRFIDGRAVDMGAPFWGVNEHRKILLYIVDANGHPIPSPLDQNPLSLYLEETAHVDSAKARKRATNPLKESLHKVATKSTSRSKRRKIRKPARRPIFWKKRNDDSNQDKYDQEFGKDTVHIIEPSFELKDEDFAILFNNDFHYMHAVSAKEAEKAKAIPICQFIQGRDQKNFQYGEGVWEKWNDNSDWKGWDYDNKDKYSKIPPHSHGRPSYNPGELYYGVNPYIGRPYEGNPSFGNSYEGNPSSGNYYGVNPSTVNYNYGGNPSSGNYYGGNPPTGNYYGGNPSTGNYYEGNPNGGNPSNGNPNGGNPSIGNPSGGSPSIGNPSGGNPSIGNPIEGNPSIGNPVGGNPLSENPNGGNINGESQSMGDVGDVNPPTVNINNGTIEGDSNSLTYEINIPFNG